LVLLAELLLIYACTIVQPQPLTTLIRKAAAGDSRSAEDLYNLVYDDLRQIARKRLRAERPDHTLQATALVNEAFLRLSQVEKVDFQCRTHFFALAATMMRRLLVDHARKHKSQNPGIEVPFEDAERIASTGPRSIEAIDQALTQLAALDPGAEKVVEMKFFAGMTDDEVAEALGEPKHKIRRDWDFAKVWLRGRLDSK